MTQALTKEEKSALASRYREVKEQVAAAANRAGRDPADVTLVAVSKTFSLAHIRALVELGHRDFGENKVQEMRDKVDALPGVRSGGDVVWHAIGHLQRNKVRTVLPRSDVFHALDSMRLAKEISKRAADLETELQCFVQVNVSGEESKFGLEPSDVDAFVDQVAGLPGIRVTGLMTLAAPAEDPEEVRPQFRLLRELRDHLSERYADIEYLSMGMSGDFAVAILEGATHVRIGSAIFGSRSYP